jgi:RND superfamily putative drug exporter
VFAALGRLASRRPWFVILGWIVFAAVVIGFAPKFEATTDQAEFLPSKYESIQAFELQAEAFPAQTSPGAIIVFDRADGKPLTQADQADVQQVADDLAPDLGPAFHGIAVQPPSENGLVQLAVVGLADDVTGFEDSSLDSV